MLRNRPPQRRRPESSSIPHSAASLSTLCWLPLHLRYQYRCGGNSDSSNVSFKKRFNRFVHLGVTEQSINALDLPAVLGDQDCRGKAHQTSELFGGVIIADQDRIVHRLGLSAELETLLLNKRNDSALALFVHRHA